MSDDLDSSSRHKYSRVKPQGPETMFCMTSQPEPGLEKGVNYHITRHNMFTMVEMLESIKQAIQNSVNYG